MLQSLLTGNIEANAATKLGAFGLDRWLELDIGGYGSDGGRALELVGWRCGRAEAKHGVELTPADAVLVGDTPLDVAAAPRGGRPGGGGGQRLLERGGAARRRARVALLADLTRHRAAVAAVPCLGG